MEENNVSITAEAPAKINLFFEVLGKRSDNFHEIISIAVPIRLFDTLTFTATDDAQIQFKCSGGTDIPLDDTNLVVRAVKLIQERQERKTYAHRRGAVITLTKRIPSQAGLGGGSSDAVAAIRLACCGWNLDIPDSELLPIPPKSVATVRYFFTMSRQSAKGAGNKFNHCPPSRRFGSFCSNRRKDCPLPASMLSVCRFTTDNFANRTV